MAERQNISSGAPWESIVGYSRAVRVGNHVWVAGTTATDETGQVVGAGDAAAQTRYILQKIESALKEAGASIADVVRTRMFVTDISQWEAIGRVHGEFFGAVRPAATMVQVARLIDPAHMIEIEVDAFVGQ
jgi:enamine deaminase RidA (YjgF/YER057c/UK114 family)